MKVRVYYNIRKKCLSVVNPYTRRVVKHVAGAQLHNVRFIVSLAGVQRIRRQNRKQVVAWAEGDMCMHGNGLEKLPLTNFKKARFNPYLFDSFVTEDGKPVYKAQECILLGKNIFVSGIR